MPTWYRKSLTRRPLLTHTITTTLLFATGDVISQQAIERRTPKAHSYPRTLRMAAYGGLVFAPLATSWYSFLTTRVQIPSSRVAQLAVRVALDQALFAPVNLGLFFTCMAVMERGGVRERVRESWWGAVVAGWKIWPVVQGVNFGVVPVEHRLLVVNFVSIGWNSYLSYLNQQGRRGGQG